MKEFETKAAPEKAKPVADVPGYHHPGWRAGHRSDRQDGARQTRFPCTSTSATRRRHRSSATCPAIRRGRDAGPGGAVDRLLPGRIRAGQAGDGSFAGRLLLPPPTSRRPRCGYSTAGCSTTSRWPGPSGRRRWLRRRTPSAGGSSFSIRVPTPSGRRHPGLCRGRSRRCSTSSRTSLAVGEPRPSSTTSRMPRAIEREEESQRSSRYSSCKAAFEALEPSFAGSASGLWEVIVALRRRPAHPASSGVPGVIDANPALRAPGRPFDRSGMGADRSGPTAVAVHRSRSP